MNVILCGNAEAVKATAVAGGYNVDAATIIDPDNYEGFDEMVVTTAVAKSYDKSLSKSYTVKANGGLNMRNGAGTGKALMVTIPNGTKVRCYGYYTAVSGVKWLCVVATVSGVQYTGFVHSGYLV